MRLIPHLFNGFFFQQTNQVASDWNLKYDWQIQGIGTNNIPRSMNFPLYAAKSYAGNVKVITVSFNDVDADRDSLVVAMDVLGDDQHQLIANDEFGRAWYVNAICIGLNEEGVDGSTASFGAVFEVDDPIWKKYVPSEEQILVNGTGNGTITPLGNQPALPIIEITPTGAGSFGFLYQRFLQIINNSLNALTNYPLNLTGAGLDTAALIADNSNKCLLNILAGIDAVVTTIPYDTVTGTIPGSGLIYCGTEQIKYSGKTATDFTGCTRGVNGTTPAAHANNDVIYVSKMAANGNDLRIYVDGAEVKRWFGGGGINSATTKIWVNWTQPANTNMTLGAVIAGAGDIATITFESTAGNIALMPTIPTSGNVLIGTEIFVYTGVNVGNLQLTGVTRAQRQTSAGAHAIGAAVKFVTHDVYMYYGSPSIAAYVVDDSAKPIINLTSSTNTSWVYAEFRTTSGLRSGEWPMPPPLPSEMYTNTQGGSANPATAMGIYFQLFASSREKIWSLYQPCGVTTATITGQKYRLFYNAATEWAVFTFEASLDGISWTVIWTEDKPVNPGGWEALDAHAAVALGATYPYIRMRGYAVGSGSNRVNYHEFDDATLVIDSTKVPTITIASEITVFNLHSVLTNAATGDVMTLDLAMDLNTVLTVNTRDKTITLYDGSNQINALTDMPIRAEWFRLLPAEANVITITDSGQVTYDFSYEDRSL